MIIITAHILDKGSQNITITANNIHALRRMGILYPRTKSNANDHSRSLVLNSSENRSDNSMPTTTRKTKATQEINVVTVD